MTHKNPALRVSSVVKEGEIKKTTSSAPKAMATTVKKPPVCQLQNKKWVVEYQDNNPSLTISETNAKQSVYVFRCTKTTIKVTGKVNSIILGGYSLCSCVLSARVDFVARVVVVQFQ